MIILAPVDTDPNGIGGGLTWLRNFKKGVERLGHFVKDKGDADIALIPAPTMVSRETFEDVKKRMPVILRVDGVPEDWRNRGTGTTRLRDFANKANAIVFQSEFSLNFMGAMLDKRGAVIVNGVDFSIFSPSGDEAPLPKGEPRILHVMWRQDPNKRPEEVIESFRAAWIVDKKATLILVGRYPKDWATYNFGFFNGERYIHIESAREQELAKIMRACDVMWYPSYSDTCPNTVLEALACGLTVERYNEVGGVKELVERGVPDSIQEMAKQYVSLFEMVLRKDVKV